MQYSLRAPSIRMGSSCWVKRLTIGVQPSRIARGDNTRSSSRLVAESRIDTCMVLPIRPITCGVSPLRSTNRNFCGRAKNSDRSR